MAVIATAPVLPVLPKVRLPEPLTVLPLSQSVVPGAAASVPAPARTIGRVEPRVRSAEATRAPPLKVRAPPVAPRLASSETERLPPLRKVPPE